MINLEKLENCNFDFVILHDLNIHKLRLISNGTATKRVGIIGYGLEIIDYVNY